MTSDDQQPIKVDEINQYCTCLYIEAPNDSDSRIRHVEDPDCPRHSPDPKHDLPANFP